MVLMLSELANILSSEICKINRLLELWPSSSWCSEQPPNAGKFDLDVDSTTMVSLKVQGTYVPDRKNATQLQETRKKGNFIITSADVAALAMSGTLDYTSGLTGAGGPSIGEVDDTGNLLVGTINGRIGLR